MKNSAVVWIGQLTGYWTSDPFGDYLSQSGSGTDATEQHYTGKERDSESGNDYFGLGTTLAAWAE
jgi:hypothetical protein